MSFSTVEGGKHLGRGVILDIFQASGTIPWRIEEFIMAQIGSERIEAKFLMTLTGIRSGPGDLFNGILERAIKT
jgi:hypothetical protein